MVKVLYYKSEGRWFDINSHITDGAGEWRSKKPHNDLTSTHQNTIDSKTSLKGSRSNYFTIVYAIEH